MTAENLEGFLEAFVSRKPFKVFTVELHNGNRFEVDHPRAILWRDGDAIFAAPSHVPIYFDHEAVVQIIDAPATDLASVEAVTEQLKPPRRNRPATPHRPGPRCGLRLLGRP